MIYKPTDLSPSAQTFDVKDTPIFFECKIDSSNVKAEGFTIKVLNSENNVVFSSIPVEDGREKPLDIKYITLIEELNEYVGGEPTNKYNSQVNIGKFNAYVKGYNLVNSGYNGTYLKFPFSVDITDRSSNTVGASQIFYSEQKPNEAQKESQSGLYRYTYNAIENKTYDEYEPVEIYNGQEYKWAITLYQLENKKSNDERKTERVLPNNPLYYDMPLTTGTVLGSNDIRIQSIYSDEIYEDYFVQPVLINGLKYNPEEPMGWGVIAGSGDSGIYEDQSNRVLIKAYDSTYGYIYPTTGENGFAPNTIVPSKSNGFRIYKRGNSPENLTAYQQVVYVCEYPIDDPEDPEMKSKNASWAWSRSLAAPGESYGTLVYYEKENPNGVYNVPNIKVPLQGNERIVLNHQLTGASNSFGGYQGSPFNGIYYPQFSVKSPVEFNPDTNYTIGDLVLYENKNYCCKGEIQGKSPAGVNSGYYWRLYTEQTWNTGESEPAAIKEVTEYDESKKYKSGDMVYIINVMPTLTRRTYYQCRGVVRGATPSSDVVGWEAVSDDKNYAITVNWFRTPDADSWGELINKMVLVTSGESPYYGKTLQIKDINENSDAYGTINETPFLFVTEKPIEIYKNLYPTYGESELAIRVGDIVKYTKSAPAGYSYIEFDPNNNYRPGEIVYYDEPSFAYYICVKATSGATSSVYPGGDLNQYWALYKAQSYYVAKTVIPGEAPIKPNGSLNSDFWIENPYIGNTGIIFYNNQLGHEDKSINAESAEDRKRGRLYIRRFDDIQSGMLLMKNSTNNIQQYVKVNSYNSKYSFITYDRVYTFYSYQAYSSENPKFSFTEDVDGGWISANQIGEGTKYQIKTFFRESDENAFYFYTTPVVTLHYENSSGVNFIEDRVLTEKYYIDYIENVPVYNKDKEPYNIGDVYWEPDGSNKVYYQVTDTGERPDVTDEWTNPARTTTDYNQYFSYNKDDIVSYDNKRDFLLYKSDQSYKYGDKVKYNGKYYMSTVDNPGTPPSNWQEVIFDDGVETTVTYVAIANVPVGKEYAPGQDNIGLYWQQYIGVLFENEGYVPAAHYYNNVKYAVGTNIIYKGLYFYVNKENESFEPRDDVRNEYGTKIWEKYTSKNDIDTYEDGAKEWVEGVLMQYDKPNNTWSEYTGEHEGHYYENGLIQDNGGTTFDKTNVYQKTSRTFYNGYCYVVVSDTALHLPTFNKASSDSDYFIRLSKGKPLNYPESAIKSYKYTNQASGEETTNNKRKYLMGDIALSKANSNNGLPDRYWVKFNNTSTEDVNNFIPNQTYWQTYYGPIFKKSDSETGYDETVDYEYNDIILDNESGLYFVQKNINIKGKGPLSPSGQKAWSVNSEYKIGDIVVYNNVIYICKSNGVSGSRPSVNSEFWDVYPWQLYIPEITERTLRVSATYDQQQYIQWKSAQWFLFDDRGENIKEKSNVFYDGDLSYTFHGLDGRDEATGADRYFIVRLILETYNGYRLTIDQTIEVMFSITEIKSEGLIDIAFDCDTASVVTTITKESGFIVPSDIAEYANIPQGGDIGTAGEMSLSGQMKYQKVSTSIEDASQISTAGPILSAAERFVQQIDYTIDTDKFCGTLIGLQSFSGPTNADPENLTAQSKKVGDFNIFIPEFLQEISGTSLYPDDEVLKERRYIKLSKNRNYMKWSASQAGTPYDGGVTIAVIDGDGNITTIEEGNLAEKDESGKNYLLGYKYHETIPLWQKKEFKAPENTNVLDVSYEQTIENKNQATPDSKYLNVTLGYSIYTTKSNVAKESIEEQDFHTIKQPIIQQSAFNNSDAPGYVDTTYSTAEFIQNGNNEAGGEETLKTPIRVRSNTSTMWSDYVFRVPFGTIVGANADQETLYTIKNVWDTVGWRWQDDEDGGSVWSDADYITEYNGYQTQIGSISLNGEEIERIDFNDESITIQDQRSKTFFKPQEEQKQLFNERRFLKGKKFIFDVDLTMDADGYITPTSIEDLSPGADGFLKIVAYTGDTNNTNK